MSPPRVTVIVPLYNKAPYITRCLDSILAQSFQDFEVIVVDDGSTDGGEALVHPYESRRLRLIHQENAGPGAARTTLVGANWSKLPKIRSPFSVPMTFRFLMFQ